MLDWYHYSRQQSHNSFDADSFKVSFFVYSYPLCAAADWHGLHRKCSLCCHGDSVLDFLGDRGGVRECPCFLRLDQVRSLLNALS